MSEIVVQQLASNLALKRSRITVKHGSDFMDGSHTDGMVSQIDECNSVSALKPSDTAKSETFHEASIFQPKAAGFRTQSAEARDAFTAAVSSLVARTVIGTDPRANLLARTHSVGKLSDSTCAWLNLDPQGMPKRPITHPSHVQDLPSSSWPRIKRDVYTVMTESDSSHAALILSVFMTCVILLSTVCFCLDTLPSMASSRATQQLFNTIETVCIQIFSADYLLRLLTAPDRTRFVVHPMNILDLISVLPWYITLALQEDKLQGTQVFRVVRLVRVLRVLKIGGRFSKMVIVANTVRESMDMLLMMVFIICLLVVFFSSLIFFCERGDWVASANQYQRSGELGPYTRSPFSSIPEAFWWCIVTIMTVGYGDVYPITVPGKFVASVTMIAGVLSLALPISVIGTNFTQQWMQHKETIAAAKANRLLPPDLVKLECLLQEHASSLEDMVKLFSGVQQALNTSRMRLHDKVVARNKQMDAERKQLEERNAELGESMSQAEYQVALLRVSSTPRMARNFESMVDEQEAMEKLGAELAASMSHLRLLLDAARIMTARDMPGRVVALRSKYRHAEALASGHVEVQRGLSEAQHQVKEVATWVRCMEERCQEHTGAGGKGATTPRVRSRVLSLGALAFVRRTKSDMPSGA